MDNKVNGVTHYLTAENEVQLYLGAWTAWGRTDKLARGQRLSYSMNHLRTQANQQFQIHCEAMNGYIEYAQLIRMFIPVVIATGPANVMT